ncbi:MAG: N-acetyl-alpha-D-glucosaminyl L-malate synthase BshA, partial [Candidatus Methanofastidiosia archaeon]
MRIGITCYPTFGGSGVVASELGRELAKHHEVHFISYSLPFRLDEKVHFHRVDMLKYPLFKFPPYTLALTSKMAEVCVKEKLELLHVHYAIPHSTSAYLAKKLTNRVKIVTTLHGTDVQLVGLDPSYKSITKFSMEKSDGLTSVSNYLKRLTIKEFGIKSHIEVIHNFIDPLKFKRRFVERKEKVIVHVSNFRRIKRIPDIIHAFKLITKRIECRLTMVGDGPEKLKAKRLAKELGLEDMVKFTGNLRDVSKVLSSSSLFLLPSEMESFGLAA